MNRLKVLFLSIFVLASSAYVNAQNNSCLCRVNVNETFSTPAHTWTLSKVEYFNDCTMCHFLVKSTEANVYLRLLPGCYLMDNMGNRYDLINSDLTSTAPGKKFSVAGEPLIFYMKFPPMEPNAFRMSLILPELKVFDEIPVGNGLTVTYNFDEGKKAQRASLWIMKIVVKDTKTIVTFMYDNAKNGSPGYWDWASISKNSTLVVEAPRTNCFRGKKKAGSLTGRHDLSLLANLKPYLKNRKI